MPSLALASLLARRRARRGRAGAGLFEYIAIVGLVAVVALLGARVFGSSIDAKAEAHARCVDTLSCADGAAVGDLPPGHTKASQPAGGPPGFGDYATQQLGGVVDTVTDTALVGAGPEVVAYRASSEEVVGAAVGVGVGAGASGGATDPAPVVAEPTPDLPGAAAAGRRMTETESYQAAASVYGLFGDGRLSWDVLHQLGIIGFGEPFDEADTATFVSLVVTPTLSNPVTSFHWWNGATYLSIINGKWVQVEVDLQGNVTNVILPDEYTVASYLCHGGRADGCAVRDQMDERARQEMALGGAILEGIIGLTPFAGTVVDIKDIFVNCPSNPLSFDCGAAMVAMIPGVPGVGRADEVVDGAQAIRRLDDVVDGAGDLAGGANRTAQDLLSIRTKYELNGVRYEINTGHAYNRVHTGPGGVPNDVRTTGLSSDAIERGIIGNVDQNLSNLPRVGTGPPYTGRVTIDGHVIEYRAMRGNDGQVFVSTYYLPP